MAEQEEAARADAPRDRTWWIHLSVVALVALGFGLAFWNTSLSPSAGGELIAMVPSTRDLLPYRDFFYQAPPGLVILARFIGAVAGPYLIAAYAVGVALRVAATCALFDLLTRVHRPRSAALGAAASVVLSSVDTADTPFYYNHIAVSLVVLGAWALARSLASRREAGWALAAGVFYAAGVIIKQTVAVAAVASVVGMLLWVGVARPRRTLLRAAGLLVAGGGAVLGATLAWLVSNGVFRAFIEQTLTRGPSAKGGFWVSITRPVSQALELPSSEPLTLLAFACAGALFVALRRPNRAAWPSFASLAAMFVAAALLGAQLDRVPLRYVTLFATSLSLWCTLAYAIHHLLAFGKDPRATAHAARVALAALGVGCAWSLGVSWPLFEMMSFPAAAVLIAALDDDAPAASPEGARALLLGAVALLMAIATTRKVSEPYSWGRWREPSVRASSVTPSPPELAHFTLSPETARFYGTMVEVIRAHSAEGDHILAYPNLAILYALSHRRPATRGLNHWVDACPDYIARADAEALVRDPPRLIVRRNDPESAIALEEALYRGGARSGARELRAALDALLARRYRLVGTFRSEMAEPIDVWALQGPLR
jgi:hypothetical protein